MANTSGKYDESKWITQEQTQEISMMALRKGAALQKMVDVTSKSSVNVRAMKNALFKLKVYAFGNEHQATMSSTEQKGSFRFSQVQIKLLRQEQLMLLSENQRLVDELQKIRKMNFSSFTSQNSASSPKNATLKTSKLVKSIDKTLMGENEVNFMRSKLMYFVATVDKVRQRILSNCLLRLAGLDRLGSLGHGAYLNAQRYYTLTKKAASLLLESVLQRKVRAQLRATLNLLKNYNKFAPPTGNHYQKSPKSAKNVTLISVHQGYQSKLPSVKKHLLNS